MPSNIEDVNYSRYLAHKVKLGDFLTAVPGNDLKTAFGRADFENRQKLFHILAYVYNEIPLTAREVRKKAIKG